MKETKTATIEWSAGNMDVPFVDDGKEHHLWKPVAEAIATIDFQSEDTIIVTTNKGVATLMVQMDESGKSSVVPGTNTIFYENWDHYQLVKLVKIDVEKNIHELYELHPNNMGKFTMDIGAKWGQTGGGNAGASRVDDMYILKSPWKPYFYWVKYYQLIKNGYEDVTDLLVDHEEIEAEFENFFGEKDASCEISETANPDSAAIVLYEKLQESAQQFLTNDMGIELNFFSSKPLFNKRQINSARKKHEELLKVMRDIGVDEKKYATYTYAKWELFRERFNDVVKKLIVATAIKFKEGKNKKTVMSFMIPSTDGKTMVEKMADACEMWDSTILAMEALITTKDSKKQTVLSPFGNIGVRYATQEEADEILKRFKADSKNKYRVYMLDCPDFRARQDEYCKEKGITVFEQLIHGSPTQNWVSLIKKHPRVNPGFTTAGKAYGWGVYTARDFNKSIHYTSYRDGIYSGGNTSKGFIGVFRCAYGKPYFPKGVGDCESAVRSGGFDCCDAKAKNSGFYMDEIIFYEEAALCLEAMIEIADCEENL